MWFLAELDHARLSNPLDTLLPKMEVQSERFVDSVGPMTAVSV